MGLDALVRKGVALANRTTASLQVTVTHEAWTGQDGYAAPAFAHGPISRQAIVEEGARPRRSSTGDVVMTRAKVTFVGPIAPDGSPNRNEPIDQRDRITLPSGFSGPIVDMEGIPADPATGSPYLFSVWLGTTEGQA